MRTSIFLCGMVLLAAVVLATAPTESAAQTVFNACYVPATGVVYRTDGPGECKGNSHVEFSWTDGAGADHGTLVGLEDEEDHPQYVLVDGVRESVNGFAVTSEDDSGEIPVTGAGNRVMWYAKKSAFRAGRLLHEPDGWDDGRIGLASIAMGFDAVASGFLSVSLGNSNDATDHSAVAMGSGSVASGHAAIALGLGAQSSGGAGSTALGWNTRARGTASLATGDGAEANGGNSIAGGFRSAVDGNVSFGFGFRVSAAASQSFAAGSNAKIGEGHTGTFLWADHGTNDFVSVAADEFAVRAKGGVRLVTGTSGGVPSTGCSLPSGSGVWACTSDRNAKENFRDEDGESLLEAISSIPIQSWSYRSESPSVRHLGPTAQDFRNAFGLGVDDKTIGTGDIDGVNMLGIKALERRTSTLRAENEALRDRLAQLEDMLLRLIDIQH